MKTYMPLNGLRWSRNSGSANCDMPQSAVFGRPGGGKNLAPTVTSSAYADNNFLVKDFRIRKLTPRECFRLMDVADSDIDKIQQAGISKTQQYKLAGNSIVVSCLYHVFRKMFIDHSNEQKGYVQLSLF